MHIRDHAFLCALCCMQVLRVDTEKKQVTVQAGCRVQKVVEALAQYGLTLQNFASIKEQQIGGFTQVRLLQHATLHRDQSNRSIGADPIKAHVAQCSCSRLASNGPFH